jgi:hypothetical protein
VIWRFECRGWKLDLHDGSWDLMAFGMEKKERERGSKGISGT